MKQEQNTIFKTTKNVLLGKNTLAEMKNLLEGWTMFEEIFEEINPNN